MEAIRVGRLRMAGTRAERVRLMAATRAELILDTGDTALRVTVDRVVCRVMAVDARQVAAGTIQRRAAADIIPGAPTAVAAAGALSVAEEVTPEVADIRAVAVIPVAEDTVAEDTAAAIAKKLGDGMSLREAAT